MRIAAILAVLLGGQEKPDFRFNGKSLDGFRPWLRESKGEDPLKVFSVVDGQIRVSGEGMGYLGTEKAYQDYRLSVEYKWGTKTDGSKYVRNSGILIHATGPDGAAGKGAWMSSIEVQLAQGCVGDLIPIRAPDATVSFKGETALGSDKRPRWSKGGEPVAYTGKQFWWSKHEAGFKELVDTRGKDDVDSPLGEWTKVELVCKGGRVTVIVNGTTVNEIFDVSPSAGRILLQNEGNEIFFRAFEIHPL
ncbi:MAG TPA: DUF1080 domain-containing protein [Planctomycetota bacterium]